MELRKKEILTFTVSLKCLLALAINLAGLGCLFAQSNINIQFKHLTTNNGLTSNNTTKVLRGSDGYIWIGTASGLSRFDGKSIKTFDDYADCPPRFQNLVINQLFEGPKNMLWIKSSGQTIVYCTHSETHITNIDSLQKTLSLPRGNIVKIEKDPQQNFWFLYSSGIVYLYNSSKQKSTPIANQGFVSDISMGFKNKLWLVYTDGSIASVHKKSLKVSKEVKISIAPSNTLNYRIFADSDDKPWIYQANSPNGVYWFKELSKAPIHFNTKNPKHKLSIDVVTDINQDKNGDIWIGADKEGIDIYKPKADKMLSVYNNPSDEKSLSNNSVSSLYCDKDGTMWISTTKGGVSYYHENLIQFSTIKNKAGDSRSLAFNAINRFVQDKDGNIWIGTDGGGLIYYNRKLNSYKQYKHLQGDKTSLGGNIVTTLFLDKEDRLWIGTYSGGLNLFKDGSFQRFKVVPKSKNGMADDIVWEVFEDSKKRFWVGTGSNGITLLDKEKGTLDKPHANFETPSSVSICSILEDREGNIWFGTSHGLEVLQDRTQTIKQYRHDPKDKNSLSNDYIADMYLDSKGRIWVATRNQLNLFDPKSKTFKKISKNEGLQDTNIQGIVEDKNGSIWVSTFKGLSKISESKSGSWTARNFSKEDGLQLGSFNEKAVIKLKSGKLLFGGTLGVNLIDPDHIQIGKFDSEPRLVDFRLFNKSIRANEAINGKVIIKEGISYTKNINLNYDQNVISFEISTLNFIHPNRVQVKYMLEGFDDIWLMLDSKSNLATFTNLNAGQYKLMAIISSDGKNWSQPYNLVNINITPPFWLSKMAFVMYAIFASVVIFMFMNYKKRKRQIKAAIEKEKERGKRIQDLDQIKTKFFTNISHEFRTPISLILSPIEKLIHLEEDESKRDYLAMIHRNANRLLGLVNQLLDFRKIDSDSLSLNSQEGDLKEKMIDFGKAFKDLASSKNIRYSLVSPTQSKVCLADWEKIERIVFNLLSNAFKFTPIGGEISFSSTVVPHEDKSKIMLKLQVKDNGIGIAPEDLPNIFNRYFQGDSLESISSQGSGIGLAITYEYIKFLGGTIQIDSKLDSGSTFTALLPLEERSELSKNGTKPDKLKTVYDKEKILVVEDNDDFRFYLKDSLNDCYQIELAQNGDEAWSKTLAFHPDLIISDVNMPGRSGIDFCKKIKEDSRTQHIPIILLTAFVSEERHLMGIEAGAADYITKPFSEDILLSKIKSHLNQKSSFEKRYKKQLTVVPNEIEIESSDEKFLRLALSTIESNIANSEYSVAELSDNLNVSRVGLYKKVLSLTGVTPSEFIRNIRLQRAKQLLIKSDLTVAEIAYEVGFNNPKAFSKYFREFLGENPSQYRKEPNYHR